ncbi:hypothetical protein FRB90_012265 [Tulasnella sp. 427]|nr:hypothetical protein FRB90_012265 [Tulasnella sp. 427]
MDFPTPFRGADKAWRQHRKLLRPALSFDTIKGQYTGLILTSAHRYLRLLSSKPDHFLLNLKRSVGQTVLELTYGAYDDGQGTDYIVKQDELLECTKRIGAGYLVDIFPLLKYVPAWFPGAKFQREASQWKEELYSLRALMREGVEKRMAASEGLACYVANELQKLEDQKGVTDGEVEAIHDSGFSFYQGAAPSEARHDPSR